MEAAVAKYIRLLDSARKVSAGEKNVPRYCFFSARVDVLALFVRKYACHGCNEGPTAAAVSMKAVAGNWARPTWTTLTKMMESFKPQTARAVWTSILRLLVLSASSLRLLATIGK